MVVAPDSSLHVVDTSDYRATDSFASTTKDSSFAASTTKDSSFASSTAENAATTFAKARAQGVKVQLRASRVALGIGLAIFVFGLACDFATGEEAIGLPKTAANVFQPIWLAGVMISLLALLPGHAKAQTCVLSVMLMLCPAAMVLFVLLGLDLLALCTGQAPADIANTTAAPSSSFADGCAMQLYVSSLYVAETLLIVMLLAPTVVWRKGQWRMPPRLRLRRLWLTARIACVFFAATTLPFGIVAAIEGSTLYGLVNIVAGVLELLLAAAFGARWRVWMHSRLFDKLHADDQSRAAAMVAAMLGGLSAEAALTVARDNFRVIAFEKLYADDFKQNDAGVHREHTAAKRAFARALTKVQDRNGARTQAVALGECDAFLSHSWSDDADVKYARLGEWAAGFQDRHGRSPLLWIDKFSIKQGNIAQGLAALPVNLAGCAHLVCLLGPSYLHRLWCLIELHTFTVMGGDASRLTVLSLLSPTEEGATAESAARGRVSAFTLRDATCFDPSERAHLLEVIASGCGSHAAFERMLRTELIPAIDGKHAGARKFSLSIARRFTSKRRPSDTTALVARRPSDVSAPICV